MELAASLARILAAGDVVALDGPLGSGKTCFVRGMAQGLGLDQSSVSSPTFVICQEYAEPAPKTDAGMTTVLPLVHIDAYRLSGAADLESIGWDEMLQAADAVIAIEWPSRIESALPAGRFIVTIAPTGEHARSITIAGSSDALQRLEKPRARETQCRTCGRPVSTDEPNFPFCSTRCKLADLGKWFDEGYRVSREIEADEELTD